MECVKIKVSKDRLAVSIDLCPPDSDNPLPSLDDVLSKLQELEIKAKINTQAIEDALAKIGDTKKPVCDITVANGQPSKNGKDGWVEFYITDPDYKPKVMEDGTVDFYEINAIEFVESNQELALYHPPMEALDGYDVFGDTIPGIKGKSPLFPAGQNTYVSPDNRNVTLAKIEGVVSTKQGLISVSQACTINGDVDFHTGNVTYKGSIIIKGDVKSGFELDSTDKIEIGGCVEDAIIKSGNDIIIKRGFIGVGKGSIHSERNISIAFVRNQSVFSRQSIFVTREVVDAKLYANDRIQVGGRRISIVGGHAIAKNAIEVETLGNEFGTSTIIETGYDYNIIEEIKSNTLKLVELQKELKKVNTEIQKLKRWRQSGDIPQKLSNFSKQQIEINQLIKKINKENNLLEKKQITPSKAFVKVNRSVYPGVEIIINCKHFHVRENMRSKTFVLSERNEITVLD